MSAPWHEEAITRKHDRAALDCGDAALNAFLPRYARQSHDPGAAKTFLAIDDASKAVLGFHGLAPAAIALDRTPEVARRGLARHDVAGFRLARIAVHRAAQGHGLGGQLLLAAGRRCLAVAAEVGGTILIIDAKNDRAAAWYARYGAVPLLDAERTLVLPLATLEAALRDDGRF
jgi:GNAT superfamily N-acetyltransferase